MGMEDVVLLAGFAAIAIVGYCMMARLDRFLEKVQQEKEEQEQTTCFKIATSCVNVIPTVSNVLKDINDSCPNIHCKLSLGHEQEVIKSFDRGDADVAIISADSHVESKTLAQWRCITLNLPSYPIDHGMLEIKTVGEDPHHQKVLWKSDDSQSLVLVFIHHLCGQGP